MGFDLYCLFCGDIISVRELTGYCLGCQAKYHFTYKNGCIKRINITQCGNECVCDDSGRTD